MRQKIKNKIWDIRNKHDFEAVPKIIFSKQTETKDRLFLLLMMIWFIPYSLILRVLWLLFYIPALVFKHIDNLYY